MTSARPPAETDPDSDIEAARLAEIMKAFGNPLRIEILRQLKWPRTLGEIRVQPARRGGGRSDRLVNRVTVKHHLDQLLAIGAVQIRRLERGGGQPVDHYVVDQRHLFVLGEELHKMARIRPQADVLDGTAPTDARPPEVDAPGAKLVLVNGTYEGAVFPLRAGRDAWGVGRRRDAAVCLDYDPYVSLDHALVVRTADGFGVEDVPRARNRTQVNWRPLPPGGAAPLRRGDVVGVGRSLLLFLDA